MPRPRQYGLDQQYLGLRWRLDLPHHERLVRQLGSPPKRLDTRQYRLLRIVEPRAALRQIRLLTRLPCLPRPNERQGLLVRQYPRQIARLRQELVPRLLSHHERLELRPKCQYLR